MGLFSDLDKMGIKQFKDKGLYEDKKKEALATNKVNEVVKKEPEKLTEADVLFDKGYTCPVCDHEFKVKTVRTGKAKSCGHDTDLRPRYELTDPLKYDAIVCDKCGYSSLTRFFPHLTINQMRKIRTEISSGFSGIDNNKEVYTYDDAIVRHKLALACCIVKGAKYSERAYTCLKLAWLIRGKYEALPENDIRIDALKDDEIECLENAYEGFVSAFSKETFPICGMDEMTITYLVAELAFRLGKYEESLKMLARVLVARTASRRIKDEALDLKDRIKEKLEKNNGK